MIFAYDAEVIVVDYFFKFFLLFYWFSGIPILCCNC